MALRARLQRSETLLLCGENERGELRVPQAVANRLVAGPVDDLVRAVHGVTVGIEALRREGVPHALCQHTTMEPRIFAFLGDRLVPLEQPGKLGDALRDTQL